MTQRRRWGFGVILLATALCAGILFRSRRVSVQLPTDPRSFVPADARLVIAVNVPRAVASGRLAPWMNARAGERCDAALARRLRTVVIVAPRVPVEGFAVAAQGDFTREALVACAMTQRDGATTERESRDGVEVLRVVARDHDGNSRSEVAYLPGAVVVAGEPAVVRAMISAAWPGRNTAPDAMARERTRVSDGQAFALSLALDPSDAGERAWLRDVRGVALGVDLEGGLSGEATFACNNAQAASAAAEGVRTELRALTRTVEYAPLHALLESAGVSSRGSEVRVRFGVGERETDGLFELASHLFEALSERFGR